MSDAPPTGVRYNTMAVTTLISAVIAWSVGLFGDLLFFLGFALFPLYPAGLVFFVGNLVAIITGYVARSQIRQSHSSEGSVRIANVGLTFGMIGVGFIIIVQLWLVLSTALLGPQIGNVFSPIGPGLSP